MKLIFRKVLFLVGLTLSVIAHSQIVTSARDGVWTDPATWLGGIVPTSGNATQIIINHEVELSTASAISAFQVVVNNKLRLDSGSMLTILSDGILSVPDLQVNGTLTCEDQSVLNGTSILNTRFEEGSFYVHLQGPAGFIPYATWHVNSTFQISGFKNSGYINAAHANSWQQTFGNVVYDCPEQTIFVVDLNGYLRNVTGNFVIKSTNSQVLRLSTTKNFAMAVGGDFRVEGPSEVWFSTNAPASGITIQGDFIHHPTSTGPSYLTTRGTIVFNVAGDLDIDSRSPLRMMSSAVDSIGSRRATINVGGNFRITNGVLIAGVPGNGKGKIVFNGSMPQRVDVSATGNSFQGDLDYQVESNAIVNLGYSVLSSSAGALLVKGRLQLGSTHAGGALQLINAGNIHIPGPHVFEEGSVIEYNGTSAQWIGAGHPGGSGVDLVCSNATSVYLLEDIVVSGDFYLQAGEFSAALYGFAVQGDFDLQPATLFTANNLSLTGTRNQRVSTTSHRLKNVTISKTDNSSVTLVSTMEIEGVLMIESTNTIFNSEGYLVLNSHSDDDFGSASIGRLSLGSRIIGDVTVQRYMSGEGRIYRYISSPISNAMVASLMDDFPVTGHFSDPSTGAGLNSGNPSLYYYDQSIGGLQEGWLPFPTSGYSNSNLLLPGKGYAAFIRNADDATIWDVTGFLNQGDMALPVEFTSNGLLSDGWNLVGNPYPSAIDWDIGWVRQNISSVVSIRDNGMTGGGFKYWDGDNSYSDIPNGLIALGQAIWVRATGPNPVLVVTEDAKVTQGASFYRQESARIPSFCLVLKNEEFTDRVYFKIRSSANAGVDEWDALKQDNEKFDIAIPTEQGFELAISARDTWPCGSERIPILVKDLVPGKYSLSLITKFEFANYTYTWVDQYLKKETVLFPGGEVEITVNGDSESSASDRFYIRLDEIPIQLDLKITSPTSICPGQTTAITIEGIQKGVYYSAWSEGRRITPEVMGEGDNLILNTYPDSIKIGPNLLVVNARSACKQKGLIETVSITVNEEVSFTTSSSKACSGERVILSATAAVSEMDFRWFESDSANDTLAATSTWLTPVLHKPKTFYVCGTSSDGCSSARRPVTADVLAVKSALISWLDATTLVSNYHQGNQWFLNGKELEDGNNKSLAIRGEGLYVLRVDTSACVTKDSLEFLVSRVEPRFSEKFEVYPNPARDHLLLKSPVEGAVDLEIRNTWGVILWRGNAPVASSAAQSIDIDFLKEGSYYIRVMYRTIETVIHFIKYH